MKLATLLLIAGLAAGTAAAQEPAPGTPSPAQQAARDAMRKACAADAQSLCANKQGRDMMMCLRQNNDKLSSDCKDAMAKGRPTNGAPPQN